MTNCTLEFVSIHALLAECDPSARFHAVNRAVSIHALLAECDVNHGIPPLIRRRFNPRTPCGVRRGVQVFRIAFVRFQSTHSLRSATIPGTGCGRSWPVSIHALLAECDASYLRWRQLGPGFNPRTPCGVRPRLARTTATDKRFQSTHSLRSATPCSIPCLTSWMSFQSTHSLRSATLRE